MEKPPPLVIAPPLSASHVTSSLGVDGACPPAAIVAPTAVTYGLVAGKEGKYPVPVLDPHTEASQSTKIRTKKI